MRPSASRRIRSTSPGAMVALAVGSVLAHVAAIALLDMRIDVMSATEPEERNAARVAAMQKAKKASFETSCRSEVTLATLAQLAVCATPFGGNAEQCADEALDQHYNALAECDQLIAEMAEEKRKKDDVAPVRLALLDAKLLEKLEPLQINDVLEQIAQRKFEEKQKKLIEEKAVAAKKIEARPLARAQVVEVTQPDVEIAPDKARYVSEYNTRVKKEIVARGTTEKMIRRPGPKDLPAAEKPHQKPDQAPPKDLVSKRPKSKIENEKGTGALAMRKPGPREPPPPEPLKKIGVSDGSKDPIEANGLTPRKGQRITRQKRHPMEMRGEDGGGEVGRPKIPDLRPSKELLQRVVGGGSVDKLDGAEKGDETALNSKRWKFATFFNRLKRQVAQNWHPDKVYLRRDPRGNVYGIKDRITVLKVTLSKGGRIKAIFVQKGSGVDFLDDEAVRAFRAAQPFPNPPAGLADPQGLISFSFGFHFQIGGRRDRWKIFRQR